jgi:hypothetical protein
VHKFRSRLLTALNFLPSIAATAWANSPRSRHSITNCRHRAAESPLPARRTGGDRCQRYWGIGRKVEIVRRSPAKWIPLQAVIEVRLGMSQYVRELFDAGDLDAVIIRQEKGGLDGEMLGVQAGRRWREVFIGGSCTALLAAMNAGLGIAPMGRVASGQLPDKGPQLGLPPLPASEIVMLARTGSPAAVSATHGLEKAIRAILRAA